MHTLHTTKRDIYRLTVFAVQPIEYVDKELVNDIHDFAVVLIDGHLKIQPHKLAQMPVSQGVLCPEHQTR